MKKLHLVLISDNRLTIECLKTAHLLGHEVVACLSDSEQIKHYCEEENIDCFKSNAYAFLKTLTYDYCIALSDISIQGNGQKWIRLKNDASSSFFWYGVFNNQLKRILQNEESDLETSFYQLLVDLSRETLETQNLYSVESVCLDQDLPNLIELSNQLNVDKKVCLMTILYMLMLRYFPYQKSEINVGYLLESENASFNLSKGVQWLPKIEIEKCNFSTMVRQIFKEIMIISMQGEGSFLNKNRTLVEVVFNQGENNTDMNRIDFPSPYFQFIINDTQLALNVYYNTEKQQPYFISNLLINVSKMLSKVLANPAVDMNTLNIFEDCQTDKNINSSVDNRKTIIQLFEEQRSLNPDAIALIDNQNKITYQELDVASNKIAQALIKHNIQREDYVMLIADRSFESVAAIIGIMKAGACYVPVSPHYPESRINSILSITQTKVILSDRDAVFDTTVLLLKAILENSILTCSFPKQDIHHLAYIIFTSGTTGNPKGVAIEHDGLASRLHWHKNRFGINKNDVILHHTNLCFDVSIEEIFLPLISGATLLIASMDIHEKPEHIVTMIEQYKVTYIEFVPSLLNMLLDYFSSRCLSLRYVISGAEALSEAVVKKFYQVCSAQLVNIYGPTECTINATYFVCPTKSLHETRYVPIGEPVGGVKLDLLDQYQNHVPVGGVGEICISGSGLARGYLTAPGTITPCMHSAEKGDYYKTGDLGRLVNSNVVEFLGRIDRQIKIRGHRVELEEIETVLLSYPEVKQAAVLLSEHEDHKKQLVAFVSFEDKEISANAPKHATDLKNFCQQRLPNYMVPNTIITLPEMPLTLGGKISFTKLSDILKSKGSEKSKDNGEASILEITIQNVFAHHLGTEIGLDDNFFDFGGNSLIAVQVISDLSKKNLVIDVADIFQYPTIKELTQYYSAKECSAEPEIAILAQNRNEQLPLSFAQHRLWYLYQLEGHDTGAYNIAMAFKLAGRLDTSALQKAINLLISRHEVIRTVFNSENGYPWQEIRPYTPFELAKEIIPSEMLNDILVHETHLPFNLETGPLYRFKLYQLSETEHVLCITMHNIITDGWSEGIIIEELNKAYMALIKNENADLPHLSIQYADFAKWQRQQFSPEKLKPKVKYWVDKLSGYCELKLYHDAPNALSDTDLAQDVKFQINSTELVQSIDALSKKASTTPYTLLVTAFNILLAFKSNQYDVIIGSGMASRNQIALQKLVGFFVNTVVLRNDLSGNPTFLELIERVKKTCIEAHQYQDVPFEMIVDALQLEREADKNPIFQILFMMQKNEAINANFMLEGISSEPISINRNTATFDITFNVDMRSDLIQGDIQFNAKLFSRDTIVQLAKDYQSILEMMVSKPNQPIHAFHLVNKDEMTQIKAWNSTEKAYDYKGIHKLFEEQVINNPSHIALCFGEQSLTYQELNVKANQLARYLLTQFSTPCPLVGVFIDRSIDYVVTVLAILKMGGAFLPLDPNYPKNRLNHYISQSGVDAIVCNSNSFKRADFANSIRIYIIDQLEVELKMQKSDDLQQTYGDLCYCIYTSGSTGSPKGILISHRNVQNLLLSMQEKLNFSNNESFLSVTSISFDIFYLELFLPLITGNTCILADQEVVLNSNRLTNLVEISNPTYIQGTPSFWNNYLSNSNSTPYNIKVLVGGEALTKTLADKLIKKFKEIWNVYGPTETTIWSTIKKITNPNEVTIGKPINNTKCYVLNDYLNPVPNQVPGELYIAGMGVAKGYIHHADLTNAVFVKNPFDTSTEYGRLYKTGDFVRYLKNGELQYLMRKDNQVKVRGFRIELAEIESQILRYPQICEAVVMVNNAEGIKDSLSAYYTVAGHNFVSGSDIQNYISQFLPSYMLPNKWIQVQQIPKTHNGKIDRNRLKEMNIVEGNAKGPNFIAPSSSLDCQLVAIWQNVLGTDLSSYSLDESFFLMGGHSLLIPQIVMNMNKEFGSKITLREFIQNPTIDKIKNLIIEKTKELEVAF